MSGTKEGLPLDGPFNPIPKPKGPAVLMIRFYEIEHDGDLGEAINCCFDAGASKIRVEETDFNGEESALIKVTTPDAERFTIALDDTEANGFYRVNWRTP